MDRALRTRRHAVAHQAVHQFGEHLFVGHRVEPVEPVPLPEPLDDARRDDRLHLVDRQLLPAHHDRLGSGQPAEQQQQAHVQLRRGGGRPEQGHQALPRPGVQLLQPRQPQGPVGKPARSVRGLLEGHRTEPQFRRGILQPRHHTDIHEGHAQRVSRHFEGRRAGYRRGLRGAETIRAVRKES